MTPRHRSRAGFTLVELLMIIALLSVMSLLAVPRFGNNHDEARRQIDDANIAFINMQWESQRITDGSHALLATLLNDTDFFPDGPPVCPFGTAYQDLDGDHRVDVHTH